MRFDRIIHDERFDGADTPHYHHGLSGTEAQVALVLTKGLAPEEIARERGAALSTIREQTALIYQKLGVHRQSELSALIHRRR